MELIGGLFAMMAGGGAAASAGGGIITSLGGAAAAGGGFGLSALSGLATTVSVIGSIGSGLAGMAAGKAEAAEHQFAARDEYIAGRETSAALKAELAKTIADQSTAFAAGGVDLGSVSVGEARKRAVRDAEKELAISSNEALSRSLARRRAARAARSRGTMSLFSGIVRGVSTGLGGAMDLAEIG
jgi:hypothetical protein